MATRRTALLQHVAARDQVERLCNRALDCSIGTIDFREIDRAREQNPCSAGTCARHDAGASIVREMLCTGARLRAIGIDSNVVPLKRIDLANAVGLLQLAQFNSRYLNAAKALSRWKIGA